MYCEKCGKKIDPVHLFCTNCGKSLSTVSIEHTDEQQIQLQSQEKEKVPSLQKIVTSQTEFGFKLFKEIAKKDYGKNIFLSPYSIATALTIAYNGADGETKKAMAKTLEIQGMIVEDINKVYAELKETLSIYRLPTF